MEKVKITDNLYEYEVACKCGCGFKTLSMDTAEAFERIRAIAGVPITINSGCRCAEHNAHEGGSKGSLHIQGKALDLRVPHGFDYDKFYNICLDVIGSEGGVGYYKVHPIVHIDTRGYKARWTM